MRTFALGALKEPLAFHLCGQSSTLADGRLKFASKRAAIGAMALKLGRVKVDIEQTFDLLAVTYPAKASRLAR